MADRVWENYQRFINPPLADLKSMFGYDIKFVNARGAKLYDNEGKEYIDASGNYGTSAVGHNHPRIQAAMTEIALSPAPKLVHASIGRYATELAEELAKETPGGLEAGPQISFLTSSGARAVISALKAAVYSTGKSKIISAYNSFHGRTAETMAASRGSRTKGFEPLMPDCFVQVPFGDNSALEEAVRENSTDLAAVLLEPVQGEAGVVIPPDDYLFGIAALREKHGFFLILDEIQTCLGRLGCMYTADAFKERGLNIIPDAITASKAFTGGGMMNFGVVTMTSNMWDGYNSIKGTLMENETMAFNEPAARIALESLRIVRDEILEVDGLNLSYCENSSRVGRYMVERFRKLQKKHNIIKEVRWRDGLMIGIEFLDSRFPGDWQEYLTYMIGGAMVRHGDGGVICTPSLNKPTIRVQPFLGISIKEADTIVNQFDYVCSVYRSFPGALIHTSLDLIKRKWQDPALLWRIGGYLLEDIFHK